MPPNTCAKVAPTAVAIETAFEHPDNQFSLVLGAQVPSEDIRVPTHGSFLGTNSSTSLIVCEKK